MSYQDFEQYFTFCEEDIETYKYQEPYLRKEKIKLDRKIRKMIRREQEFKLKEIRIQGKIIIIENYF